MKDLNFAYAGNRDISVWVLEFILSQGLRPSALLIPDKESHSSRLCELCPYLESDKILFGKEFESLEGINLLSKLELDYIICVHFPYIIPKTILSLPRIGVLNLHPAFLPFNRGWHTPSWSILENTPIGATLHFMDNGIDTGDIIFQKKINVLPEDTANSLYQRLKKLEFEVFKEAWPQLASNSIKRQPQNPNEGTVHKRKELFNENIQKIELNEYIKARDLIRKLRALTTNSIEEAAYYEVNGTKYRIQLIINEESEKNNK